ncbi:M23 family metallopeptidase [Scatolibacter rhodanostii]|uniref:M23 family metallopeptidase n=1 Tax=Scatolibacter rhodanostii TaxID=2014781 RepID=UPI000C068EDA|nr:M23 family metallopeptidase [Scatolibacter rhodanostii]
MSGKRFSGDKAKKNGFYLALAVCLVAVGIAAWSTYEAVQGYLDTEDNIPISESNTSSRTAEDNNFVKSTPAPTPNAQPTDAEEGTTGETSNTEETNTEVEENAPVAETGPLYLVSEVMIHPVSSETILKAYSKGTPVFSPTMKDWRIHTGTDFAAATGEEVKASANGVVQDIYTDFLLGNIVAVEHGDYVFYYCGLGEQFEVEKGEIISAGQIIGKITAVPSEAAEESHLHLEVKRDGAYLDPTEVLAQFKSADAE